MLSRRVLLVVTSLLVQTSHLGVQGYWALDCRLSTTEKSDPIVFFGQPNATHTHVVAGSSGFGPSATSASIRGDGT